MKPFTIPVWHRRHRLWAIAYGALLFFWMSSEQNTLWVVSAFGAGLAVLGLAGLAMRYGAGQVFRNRLGLGLVFGAGSGFCAVWVTLGLMIFKNAWHSHALPDFPAPVVLGLADRLWAWTLAGALWGLGLALWTGGD
jgi:hypothetical protein